MGKKRAVCRPLEEEETSALAGSQDERPMGLVQAELRARLTQTVLPTQINGFVNEKK